MHIILTGATGSVGVPALLHCLASPAITQLSILSRRQFTLPSNTAGLPNFNEKKAKIIVHKDFSSYPDEVLNALKGAEGCIWAQGISQTEVSKEDYIRITYDYPLAAAKAFSTLSNTGKFNFVYVSGEGADPTEKTYTLFGKIKGRAETALLALPSNPEYSALRIFNLRPGFVDPSSPGRQQGFLKGVAEAVLGPLLRRFYPSGTSPSSMLGRVLVDIATGKGEPIPGGLGVEADGRTLRNTAIRRLGGVDPCY